MVDLKKYLKTTIKNGDLTPFQRLFDGIIDQLIRSICLLRGCRGEDDHEEGRAEGGVVLFTHGLTLLLITSGVCKDDSMEILRKTIESIQEQVDESKKKRAAAANN